MHNLYLVAQLRSQGTTVHEPWQLAQVSPHWAAHAAPGGEGGGATLAEGAGAGAPASERSMSGGGAWVLEGAPTPTVLGSEPSGSLPSSLRARRFA